MNYTHIVWDFNGTLLNDVDAGIHAVNRMLAPRGLPILENADAYRAVFCFPIREYYAKLGFDFDKEPYEVLAPEWVANYKEAEKKCASLHEDAVALLKQCHRDGYIQILLSATEQNMLESQLEIWSIRSYFSGIYGLDNIHAHSKESAAIALRKNYSDAKILMIGDTVHDVESAKTMGADCVLCCKGHQSASTLEKTGCPVYSDFDQIARILRQ